MGVHVNIPVASNRVASNPKMPHQRMTHQRMTPHNLMPSAVTMQGNPLLGLVNPSKHTHPPESSIVNNPGASYTNNPVVDLNISDDEEDDEEVPSDLESDEDYVVENKGDPPRCIRFNKKNCSNLLNMGGWHFGVDNRGRYGPYECRWHDIKNECRSVASSVSVARVMKREREELEREQQEQQGQQEQQEP